MSENVYDAMNEKIYDGEKARHAKINAEILDGQFRAFVYGKEDDVALCLEQSMTSLIKKYPSLRKRFRRATMAAMWETAPEWLRQFVRDLPWGITGATLMFWAVYGVGAVLHWMGVV